MSQMTKRALVASLKDLLAEKPLDKITVTDLTEHCGVNRMTFYYHFKDIYDLVEWACIESATRALAGQKTYDTWQQGFLQILQAVQKDKVFVTKVYHSISREHIENYLYRLTYDLMIGVVEEKAAGMTVRPEDKEFIANFYKYAFVGPSIRPTTETIEKTHDVLIYISMGTVNNDLLPFYRACIAAFADSPYQVILSTGEQIDRSALGTLPDNITALPHVDQIAVLQKADVFLSHCGMNSASESLYFGVPLVLFPQTNEQGGVAARVAELGAGLKLEKADAASIRTAVDAVLQTPSYRANAQNIRESFLRCGGAKAAVDRILSVADRK